MAKIVVVIDGSKAVQPHLTDIAAAIETCTNMRAVVFFAGDTVTFVGETTPVTRDSHRTVATAVRQLSCAGGRNNAETLCAALDAVGSDTNGAVLWIHGPQTRLLSDGSAVKQRLDRPGFRTAIWELPTDPGQHRLLDKLDGAMHVSRVVAGQHLQSNIVQVLQGWQTTATILHATRTRISLGTMTTDTTNKAAARILQLWARDTVAAAYATGGTAQIEEVIALGARHRVATPLTAAVVLENERELTGPDTEPVPPPEPSMSTVPEADVWCMIAVALAVVVVTMLYMVRRPA